MAMAAGMQKKQWTITPPDPRAADLAAQLRISPLLAQLLVNRKVTAIDDARNYISPKLTGLIEPERMPGIAPAVRRIKQAITDAEPISIYGDYDVDGITSVAILWHLLTMLGAKVDYYIPHRIDEGYGLNDDAVTQLAKNGTKLIITVDCGITAIQQTDLANQLGIDVIISDHHQPSASLPDAVAIVHPLLESYPNPDSAGATVAMKIAWALANEYKTGPRVNEQLRQFLLNATTLAAIGTIADVVDLRGENRILASWGLKAVTESKLPGIKAIIESADLTGQDLDSYHIAFRLAPMLNAAGRMGHARLAVELLTSDSTIRCIQIANYLKEQNRLRQQQQRKIYAHARELIAAVGFDHPDRKSIVIADESWHSGIIGIVASRLTEDYLRPVIMISTANSVGQGSARSVEGFHILNAIASCRRHLIKFGGHAMAAGVKIEKQNIPAFAEGLEQYAEENLAHESLVSKIHIDTLCRLSQLTRPVVNELALLEPLGQGNPRPLFATRGVRCISPPRKVGQKGAHLQLAITDDTASIRCIGFGMGKLEKKILESESFSVAYQPQINHFNGTSSVQLVIDDIQFE